MEYTHRENLCEGLYGTGDIYPNKDYNPYFAVEDYKKLLVEAGDDPDKKRRAIQKTAPATYYTCASKADGITTFPCTGSKHKEGAHILCSCDCHVYEDQTNTPNVNHYNQRR